MTPEWRPEDPCDLPEGLSIARAASALWWPTLRVLRVGIRTHERPHAMAALDGALRERGVDPTTVRVVCSDKPYTVPAMVGNYCIATKGYQQGRWREWWAVYTYRPQMRVNDRVWTWRRQELVDTRTLQPSEQSARENARASGLVWLPEVCASDRVTPDQIDRIRAERAQREAPCA